MGKVIRDGDVFRWRYKDERPDDRRPYNRYHCKSMIAVAKGGLLIDTYWSMAGDNSTCWSYETAVDVLELERLGNFAELEKRPEYDREHYDDADIVDLNHSNSSRDNFYIRKGAPRSRTKMLAVMSERVANAEREIGSAQRRLELARAKLAEVGTVADLDKVYL